MNLFPPCPRAEDRFPKVDMDRVRQRRTAHDLFKQGLSYKTVAELLGVSVWTVRDWHREWKKGRFNVVPTVRPYRRDFRLRVLKDVTHPKEILAVSRRWDVPYATLQKWYVQEQKTREEVEDEQNL